MTNLNEMKVYKTLTELNPPNHPSTGNVVCYYGLHPRFKTFTLAKNAIKPYMYVRISDCHNSIDLHNTDLDDLKSFIKKIKLLIKSLQKFVSFLEIIDKEESKKPLEFPKPPSNSTLDELTKLKQEYTILEVKNVELQNNIDDKVKLINSLNTIIDNLSPPSTI